MDHESKTLRYVGGLVLGLTLLAGMSLASVVLRPSSEAYLFGPNPPDLVGLALGFSLALAHLALGIGLLYLTKWGYFLCKVFLYVLFLAFPLGTFLARRGLEYLRRPQVKRQFGFEGS